LLADVPRIARYIARQMLPWIAAALASAALLFFVTQLLRIAPLLIGADASFREIARDLTLLLVPILSFALAPAFAVAVFAVGGRMSEDGELIALDASGVTRAATATGPIVLAFAFALGSAGLWLVASPAACRILRDDAVQLAGRALAGRITPGRFAEPFPGITVYADAVSGTRLGGVFVADSRSFARTLQITAAFAEIRHERDGAMSIALENGEAFFMGAEDGDTPAALRFESLSFRLPVIASTAATDAFLPALLAESTSALLGPPPRGVDPDAWGFALWRRLGGPIGFLALALASTALAFAVPWRRRGLAIGAAAALFLAFHATGRLAEQLLFERAVSPALAALLPGAAVVAVGVSFGVFCAAVAQKLRCSKNPNRV